MLSEYLILHLASYQTTFRLKTHSTLLIIRTIWKISRGWVVSLRSCFSNYITFKRCQCSLHLTTMDACCLATKWVLEKQFKLFQYAICIVRTGQYSLLCLHHLNVFGKMKYSGGWSSCLSQQYKLSTLFKTKLTLKLVLQLLVIAWQQRWANWLGKWGFKL